MKKSWLVLFLVAGSFFPLFISAFLQTANANPNENIGVVILHGNKQATQWIGPLLEQFKKAKITVISPKMTWSESRNYDASFDESLIEIDKAISTLKDGGATKIFIGGHSMGASAAAAYAVANNELSGLILIAPGHTNAMEKFEDEIASNIASAHKLISDGKGDKKTTFKGQLCSDVAKINPKAKNANWSIRTTPEIYLSHFDPDYKDMMSENIKKIGKNTALLLVVGNEDSWVKENAENLVSFHPETIIL